MITKLFNHLQTATRIKLPVLITVILLVMAYEGFSQDTTALLVIKNVPIVEGTINGKPAYFVVDTGASITILNGNMSRKYGYRVIENRYLERCRIIGLGGESSLREARFATVKLGSHELNFINRVADLESLSNHFDDYDLEIAGIIGTDLLRILGSKIDMAAGTIMFNKAIKIERRPRMEYFADKE